MPATQQAETVVQPVEQLCGVWWRIRPAASSMANGRPSKRRHTSTDGGQIGLVRFESRVAAPGPGQEQFDGRGRPPARPR